MIETPGNAEHIGKVGQELLVLRAMAGGDLARDLDVAARRQRGQQIELLKDKANLRLAQYGSPGVAQRGEIDAIDQNAARGCTRKPAKNIEERRFAAARGPDNADELTRRNDKRHPAQRRNVHLARMVNLAQVLCRNNGLHVLDCIWQRAVAGLRA